MFLEIGLEFRQGWCHQPLKDGMALMMWWV